MYSFIFLVVFFISITEIPYYVSSRKFKDDTLPPEYFCHSDSSISYNHIEGNLELNRNCYGTAERKGSKKFVRGLAIEMPFATGSLLRRCQENPYHAFYDCIWPLVHFISNCVPSSKTKDVTIILTKHSLNRSEKKTWADQAVDTLVKAFESTGFSILDTTQITSGKLVCFSSTVELFMKSEWRPPKLYFRETPHREKSVASSLDFFRSLIIKSIPEINRSPTGHIIVYDRGDARRRRWTNGYDFAYKLNRSIGNDYPVFYIWRQPDTFVEQVALHSGAIALIAPHGASFANSLFMPPYSVLIEIASRNCGENISHLVDTRNENAWTAWHASKLKLEYLPVKCNIARDRSKLIATDNQELLKTTIALIQSRQEKIGFS